MGVVDWNSPGFWESFRQGVPETLEAIYWMFADAVEHVLATGFVTKLHGSWLPGVSDPDKRCDLLQEVFMKAFAEGARQSFAPQTDYRPYLLTIARHTLADHHRSNARDRRNGMVGATVTGSLDDDAHVSGQEHEEPRWTAPALVQVVEGYVAHLEQPLKDIHRLRFAEGKTQREVSQLLGLSRQNIRTLEAQLKEGLRRALQEAWHLEHSVRAALDGSADILHRAAGPRKS